MPENACTVWLHCGSAIQTKWLSSVPIIMPCCVAVRACFVCCFVYLITRLSQTMESVCSCAPISVAIHGIFLLRMGKREDRRNSFMKHQKLKQMYMYIAYAWPDWGKKNQMFRYFDWIENREEFKVWGLFTCTFTFMFSFCCKILLN